MHAYFGDKGGAKKMKKVLEQGAKHKALKERTSDSVHKITRKGGKYHVHNPSFPTNKSNAMNHKKANDLRKTLDVSYALEQKRKK